MKRFLFEPYKGLGVFLLFAAAVVLFLFIVPEQDSLGVCMAGIGVGVACLALALGLFYLADRTLQGVANEVGDTFFVALLTALFHH